MICFGKVAVLGDSISTFSGFVPEGNQIYYPQNNVCAPEDTWWHRLVTQTGSELVLNDSWSGSTISYLQYGRFFPEQSFIWRAERIRKSAPQVDTLFVFGATNDDWGDNPLGDSVDKPVAEYTDEELRSVRPAVNCLMRSIHEQFPGTRVIVIINCDMTHPEIADELELAGKRFGADIVRLHDIEKENGHPTATGMEQIKDQILAHVDR